LIFIATGKETSATLAEKLGVSPRQVNRYILGLVAAGWKIERVGVPTHGDYWFELQSPRIVLTEAGKAKKKRQGRRRKTSKQRR